MGHPHLSPELNAIVERSQQSNGFFVKDLPVGIMITITANKFECTIVVVKPENNEVALISNDERVSGPDIWIVRGSNFGGSGMKVGWIGTDGKMIMNRLAGGQMTSHPVNKWEIRDDPAEAKRIADEAEAKRPKEMTPEEEAEHDRKIDAAIEKLVVEKFDQSVQARVRTLVNFFENGPGKIAAISLLLYAKEQDKLDRAIELLQRDCDDDWEYKPPSVRGDPGFLPLYAQKWENLYAELGLPLPNKK